MAVIAVALLDVCHVLQVQPADPATAWMGQQQQQPAQGSSTYSSIAEALAAAADGDTIQLLPGTHIISQVCHTASMTLGQLFYLCRLTKHCV